MKRTLIIITLILTSFLVKAGNYQITVWGYDDAAGFTKSFLSDLDKNGLKYTYYDVLGNNKNLQDMYDFANTYHLFQYPQMYPPVVKVVDNGIIYALVRPQVETILKLTPVFEIKNTVIKVYPNPAKDVLHVSGTSQLIRITDISGREVMSSMKQDINVSKLPTGIYFVKTGNFVGKFVKL